MIVLLDVGLIDHCLFIAVGSRVSSETSFGSKQPKLEPKLVSALSKTRGLFRLFHFNIKTGSFSVLKQPNNSKLVKIETFLIPHVPDHDGGRPMEVNACILIIHMVYI
jgi:hypothetical protein